MSLQFDLTLEPWIPAERLSGERADFGIEELLINAHELRGLGDLPPTQYPTLLRLLLAVLHRVFDGPKTRKDWRALRQAGLFDSELIKAYLGKHRERFDLFHPTHPFAQTPGLDERFKGKETPVGALLFPTGSWGAGAALFYGNEPPPLTPAEAARALLAYHAFAPGGLIRKPGEPASATAAPNNSTAIISLVGNNLFETLCDNLLVYDGKSKPVAATPRDRPSWEGDPPPRELPLKKEPAFTPAGWLDMLTWVDRRLLLIPSEDGLIRSFVRAVGKGVDGTLMDPMVAYRDVKKGSKTERVAVGVQKDRLFWRNCLALFVGTTDATARLAPAAIRGRGSQDDYEGQPIPVLVHGMASYQARIDAIREECLWVAPGLFEHPKAHGEVDAVLGHASFAVGGLKVGLQTFARRSLASGDRDVEEKDAQKLASSFHAEETAWSELELHFQSFLRDLGHTPESSIPQTTFLADCLLLMEAIYTEATTSLGDECSQAQVEGSDAMKAYLAKLYKTKRERTLAEERE